MQVAIVVNSLKIGGMERVAVNLADSFLDVGHKADLIYLKNRTCELSPKNKALPIHLFNLKKSAFATGVGIVWFIICKLLNLLSRKTFPIWFAYVEALAFKKHLRALEKKNGSKFDLVIFRGQGTFEHLWPLQDARFVYVCENVQKADMYGPLSRWVFSKLFNGRNVTCVSDGALNSFRDMTKQHGITPRKSVMLNNPNDFLHIQQQATLETKPLHEKPYILGLGRIVPQKNFSLLVQAYDYAIKNFGIQQDLVLVGDGNDRATVENEVTRLGLNDRVHFKGSQTNPFPWYQQADLYVLSSKHEGLGMVLIESLACGTKVVSTDSHGGVRQIMNGELERFLAKETPDSLGTTINEALNFKESDAFSNFVQDTLKRFDGKTIVDNYLKEFT